MDRDRPAEISARRRFGRAARNAVRRLGRWLLWTGLIALFLWKAPVISFRPICSELSFGASEPLPPGFSMDLGGDNILIEGPMTKEFVDEFTDHLEWWKVSYQRLGNNVFLSFWTDFSGGNDGILNSNNKALDAMGNRLHREDTPPEIRTRAESRPRKIHVSDDCLLARAVAIENWGRGD